MLRAELAAVFGRARVRVLLGILFMVPVLLAVAVYLHGGSGGGPAFLDRVSHNGVFAAMAGLTVSIPFLLPLSVAVVAGDTISGEASLGTLRYLLTRPAGRTRLLAVKAATVVTFCLVAGLTVAVGGLVAGAVFFPLGQVVTLSGTVVSFGAGIGRTLAAAVLVGLSMTGIASIGVFISTLTDVPVGAMAGTAGLVIASLVLDSVPQVAVIHPWLFTHHWLAFGDFFRTPVGWHGIELDIGLQLGYVAVFGSGAWARFTTKDVLA